MQLVPIEDRGDSFPVFPGGLVNPGVVTAVVDDSPCSFGSDQFIQGLVFP